MLDDTPTISDVQTYWDANPAGYAEVKHLENDRRAFFDERDRQTCLLYPHLDSQYGFALAQGKRTLELGCGMGYNAQRLAESGARLTLIDLAPKAVRLAQERFALRHLHADFLTADAEHLPFAPNTFEMVFSSGAIHHSSDTKAAAHEIVRVIAPGGSATVMIYHRDSIWFWWNIIVKLGALMWLLNNAPAALRDYVLSRFPRWRHYILPPGRRITLNDVIRSGTDFGGALNPISRVYTRDSARKLFPGLTGIQFVIADATFRPFSVAPAFLLAMGRRIKDWLNRRYGFFLIVHGVKPLSRK